MGDTHYQPAAEHHPRIVACPGPDGQDRVRKLLAAGTLAGGIFSTARDLTRFGKLFLAAGRAAGPAGARVQVLSPPSVGAMLLDRTGHLPAAPETPPGPRHFGLGWMLAAPALWMCDLASPRAFGHTGSSGAFLLVDPSYDLVVAFLANRWGGAWTGIVEVMNAVFASVAAE